MAPPLQGNIEFFQDFDKGEWLRTHRGQVWVGYLELFLPWERWEAFPSLPWDSFPSTEPPAPLTQVHLRVEKEIPTFFLCSGASQRSQTIWHWDSSCIFKAICNNQPLKGLQGLIEARACSALKSTRSFAMRSFNGVQSSYSCKEAAKAVRIIWKRGRNKGDLAQELCQSVSSSLLLMASPKTSQKRTKSRS